MPSVAVAQWPRINAAHRIELGVESAGKVNMIPGQKNPRRRQGAGTNSWQTSLWVAIHVKSPQGSNSLLNSAALAGDPMFPSRSLGSLDSLKR
jgi:hypothetical protein